MSDLIFSAFSDEYADSFAEQLAAMNRFGIGHIELRHADQKNVSVLSDAEVAMIRRQLQDTGIKVSAIGSPLGKITLEDPWQEHLDLTKRICEIARELDSRLVRMFSFYLPKGEDPLLYRIQVLERLAQMLEIADSFGVTFGHENEAGIYGESPERCLDLLETFGGKLRCVFDMGNFLLCGYPPYPEAYQMLKPYLEWFHIKDGLARGAIVPPGKGEASIREILEDYQKNGEKDVFMTLEPHLQTFSGLNALTDSTFENPYVYNDQQEAFTDAVNCLKEILQ